MLIRIENVLTAQPLASLRARLDAAPWVDGRLTAGHQSAQVKDNLQLSHEGEVARALSVEVLRALEGSALFISAALPRHVFPPLFSRYETGMQFGTHIDNAVRQIPGTAHRLRTDLSATLFLSAPEDYDGGELAIEDSYGEQRVKLRAGDMVLYPAGSRHRVSPITRGVRTVAFFWVQSMVADDGARALLFELDGTIRDLTRVDGTGDSVVRLTGCYHNLLRRWAQL
jgi:PKHD-type hydroxylase